jgi:hypothetical protein
VAHHHDVRQLVDLPGFGRVCRLGVDERRGIGKALMREERRPIVDHDRSPAEPGRVGDEGHGVMAGPAHEELQWRLHLFDEDPQTGALLDAGTSVPFHGSNLIQESGVPFDLSSIGHDRVTCHDVPQSVRQRREQDERTRRCFASGVHVERLSPGCCGFHEHFDRAVAPEPPAPDRLFVRGQVVGDEFRLATVDHPLGDLDDLSLEAAAGEVADPGTIGHRDQTCARVAVGRSLRVDDGCECERLARLRCRSNGLEHHVGLRHRHSD